MKDRGKLGSLEAKNTGGGGAVQKSSVNQVRLPS